jgi:hypothetical protein
VTNLGLQVHANGGYFGEPVAWVLPLLGNVTGPALLAEAVAAARADGDVAEWRNSRYCCNCAGPATNRCITPWPSTALFKGVRGFGPAVFSLYAAAALFKIPGSTRRGAGGRAVTSPAQTGTATRTSAAPAHNQTVAVPGGGGGGATGRPAERTNDSSVPGGRLASMGRRTGPGDRGRRLAGVGRLESAGGDPDFEWLVGYASRYLKAALVCAGPNDPYAPGC